MTAPRTAQPLSTPSGQTHGCARCGAPVAIDVGLCERCNPLGLRDSASSQVHGLAIGGVALFVVVLAVVARLALAGIGPFEATVNNVAWDAAGVDVTLVVTNAGRSAGQTTCRVFDPADRTGNRGALMLSPQIPPGESVEFTQRITTLGGQVVPLRAECKSP